MKISRIIPLLACLASGLQANTTLDGNVFIDSDKSIAGEGRLHITGPERLYVMNINGLHISNDWGGSGELSVDGPAAFHDEIHLSPNLTIKGHGRLNLDGNERIYFLNKNGVHISKAWGGSGEFSVEGPAAFHDDINLNPNVTIKGHGRMHIDGNEILYLLNRDGVHISKAWGGNGHLYVDGVLRVHSEIITRKVKVKGDTWSDHVFEEDYQLATLDEVEAFIDENGHLPKVPSAAELAETGISVNEMLAKHMEKIEELTLYSIDQNKQITEQQQQIAHLESLVQQLLNSNEAE